MTASSRARPRARRAAFDLEAYAGRLDESLSRVAAARHAALRGEDVTVAAAYDAAADLFTPASVEALRTAAASDGERAAHARAMLPVAVSGALAAAGARMADAIERAEADAVIVWRDQQLPYRRVPSIVAEISERSSRNALDAAYHEAVEAINPLREERLERMREASRALGATDVPTALAEARGIDLPRLAAEMQRFLIESETPYFAALRRYLAEIDIEQGDASEADLRHVLRGGGWDAWFDARRLLPAVRATVLGLGIDPATQADVSVDLDDRPAKTSGFFEAAVRLPGDVRVVGRSNGGYRDYAALLDAIGRAEFHAHMTGELPAAYRRGGDEAVGEGYGQLFASLVRNDDWLGAQLGLTEDEMVGWIDFAAFARLHKVRREVALTLYEMRLHRGDRVAVDRAYYSGLLGLLTGVRHPEAGFLAAIAQPLSAASRFRAACFAASVERWLASRFKSGWWRIPEAGTHLRNGWSRGLEWNADTTVAHLGYDRLDWRPLLRQLRTQLIGEMSGYGGPNITTRAGTRKV